MSVVTDNPIAEIRAMLAQRPPTAGSFEDRRSRWEPLYTSICPVLPGTWMQPVDVAGLRAEWVCGPGVSPREQPVVLYIHGGGFTAGTVVAYRGLSSRYSAAAVRMRCSYPCAQIFVAPSRDGRPPVAEDSTEAWSRLKELAARLSRQGVSATAGQVASVMVHKQLELLGSSAAPRGRSSRRPTRPATG
jgi:hypothetical protein